MAGLDRVDFPLILHAAHGLDLARSGVMKSLVIICIGAALFGCSATDGLSDDYGTGVAHQTSSACRASALAGRFDIADVSVKGDEGACITIAREMSSQGQPRTLTLSRIDDATMELRSEPFDPSPTLYTLDATHCELTRNETHVTRAPDANRRSATVDLTTIARLTFADGRLSGDSTSEASSETEGASGFPCKISARIDATKQR